MRQTDIDSKHRRPIAATTLLRSQMEERVRRAIVPPGEILPARGMPDFSERVSRASSDVAVLDPELGLEPNWYAALAESPVPLVVYMRLVPEALARVVAAARLVPFEVMCAGDGESDLAIAARLEHSATSAYGRLLYQAIEPRVRALPGMMRDGIAWLCESVGSRDSPVTLAARCSTSVAALTRNLASAGIRGPGRLVLAARVVRAYSRLRGSDIPARMVAQSLGLASSTTLNRQVVKVSGFRAEDIRRGVAPGEFIAACAAWLGESAPVSQR